MTHTPLVSVVMPAYNAAAFVGEALQSALDQTYQNIEVIVVDDGSEDETRHIAERLAESDDRVSVLHQPNSGVAAARNLAIDGARGEYIAPLDADDVWYPEKIEKQVRRMDSTDASTGLVYGWYRQIDPEGVTRGDGGRWLTEGYVYNALALRNFIGGGSMPLMKRSCLEEVGGYDPRLRERGGEGCEDWDLYLRIAARYQFRVVPEFLAAHRRHQGNMSLNRASMALSHKMVTDEIERRVPRVPRRILRWSKARRCLFELRSVYRKRDYRSALALGYEALGLDPIGLFAFLCGKARARIFEPAEAESLSYSFRALIRKPYEVLSLRRFYLVSEKDGIDHRRRGSPGASTAAKES